MAQVSHNHPCYDIKYQKDPQLVVTLYCCGQGTVRYTSLGLISCGILPSVPYCL